MADAISPPPPVPPRRRGCRTGCGLGCLVIVLLAAAAAYFGYRFVAGQYNTVMERFEREGYSRVQGQIIDVRERIREPTIFVGQVVKIRASSDRGLAFLCQSAELHGDVVGNVHFIGQVLTVDKGAVLHRDLDLKCQVANVYGVVSGKITGAYQMLNRTPPAE